VHVTAAVRTLYLIGPEKGIGEAGTDLGPRGLGGFALCTNAAADRPARRAHQLTDVDG